MPGQVPVRRFAMIGRLVPHTADDREAMRLFREPGHVLTEAYAGDRRGNRAELAADVATRVRLGIPRVEVAHAAPGEQDDARARGARSPDSRSNHRVRGARFAQRENLRYRQAQRPEAQEPASVQDFPMFHRWIVEHFAPLPRES